MTTTQNTKTVLTIRQNAWGNFGAYSGPKRIEQRAQLWDLVDALIGEYPEIEFKGYWAKEAKEIETKLRNA